MQAGQMVRVRYVRDDVFQSAVGRQGCIRQVLPEGCVELAFPRPIVDSHGRAHNPIYVREDELEVLCDQDRG